MISLKWKRGFEFNPGYTFESGQVFRWRKSEDDRHWTGIVSGNVISVNELRANVLSKTETGTTSVTRCAETIHEYFSERENLNEIISTFPKDELLTKATKKYSGLRLLTQDPWECLISFVCSINSNIPSIKFKIENLCRTFGEKIAADTIQEAYSFPTPISLARAEKSQLIECKVGFRWKYIQHIAKKVESGELDLQYIRKLPYEKARAELISSESHITFGVGPKVADCVMLFSMSKSEAFPMDVWMNRCISQYYFELVQDLFPNGKISFSGSRYFEAGNIMRRHFGKYAGYAQQYLYMYTRNNRRLFDEESRLER